MKEKYVDVEDLPPVTPGGGRAHRVVLTRAPLSARELAFSLALLVPVPLVLVVVSVGVTLALLVALVVAVGLGTLFRRLPTPTPSIAAIPVGFVWVGGVVLLPSGAWGLATGLVAGIALVLYAALPGPQELTLPLDSVVAQAAIPSVGAALSFAVAISLLGVSAPVYDLALVPTLGALALVVYLFGRGDVVPPGPAPTEPVPAEPTPRALPSEA